MKINKSRIHGPKIFKPKILYDNRGSLFHIFEKNKLKNLDNINYDFKNEIITYSKKNVLRGLHFQLNPYAQAKLITVIKGKIFDIYLDLRENSSTKGEWASVILDTDKINQILIPEGFAHGYYALENSIISYKLNEIYSPKHESGIIFNDKTLNIKWPFKNKPIISKKDLGLKSFQKDQIYFI